MTTRVNSSFLLRTASLLSRHRATRFWAASFAPVQRQPSGSNRLYSSTSTSSFHPSINSTLSQLDSCAIPKFEMPSGAVQVLTSPSEFYALLKDKIAAAQKRIFLATLYIGRSEHELINCLQTALRKNPELQVYILSDALRGTREAPVAACSASLMAPLVEEFGDSRVQLRMYHTPQLSGFKKKFIPNRFNEGWGLQHMKLYGFDDEIILSGANLSNDYFTDRQDRYILFKSAPLTEYYFKIHQAVASLSYSVVPKLLPTQQVKKSLAGKIKAAVIHTFVAKKPDATFSLEWTQGPYVPDPIDSPDLFIQNATKVLSPLLYSKPTPTSPDCITVVYPISQFSPLLKPKDLSTEFPVISRVLSMLSINDFNWTFTAGYFNIHPDYKAKLLTSSPPNATVICAAPKANGFYESKGVSGLLPAAYSLLASHFLTDVEATKKERQRNSHINVVEWERGTVNTPDGWSFHAKGIWISEPESSKDTPTNPCMTVVGSSNYTRRAYAHDLESNALIVTRDVELQAQLGEEVKTLMKHTGPPMTAADYEKRKPAYMLKALTWLLGGKL